jgi:acyl-CoA thioester hydrolase
MEIDFKRGAGIDEALLVRTTFERVTGARFHISQRLERDGHLVCAAEVEVACIDLSGRPRRMPKDLAAKLLPWLAPHAP